MANVYRYLQRSAHEYPVVFYSVALGIVGPVMVLVIPPTRRAFGWRPTERVPTTFPLPNRPRRAVEGFDDP